MSVESKNEIKSLFEKFPAITYKSNTQNKEMLDIIEHLEAELVPNECPDAYIVRGNFIYAIEHFRVSLYAREKKSDLSKVAEGSKKHRDKLKNDRNFSLAPSLSNLFNSLQDNLAKHSKSFVNYKKNITEKFSEENYEYRLIIFIEDITDGYIVKSCDVNPINPLNLSTVIEILLKYHQDSIWGVIYVYGNGPYRCLSGCTIEELKKRQDNGDFLPAENYVPFEMDRNIEVSKDDPQRDRDNVTIKLYDRICFN